MPTTVEIATRYFQALTAHDLDAAVAVWKPGAVDRMVGDQELIAPDGIRAYFSGLFDAMPDFALQILETTTADDRTAVRWKATGTFAGPGKFQGFAPNHARIAIEGLDVVTVQDGLIVHNDAFIDSGAVARQLGLLPENGSSAQLRLAAAANVRTKLVNRMRGTEAEPVADGVWVVRGGFPLKTMNVYLLADDGGVTVFDAGIDGMQAPIHAAAARLGGIRRVVLGHADADHRGAAGGLAAPVFCHSAEQAAAASADSLREYFDLTKLKPYARPFFKHILPVWDGGPVPIEGTVGPGDEIAGFRVVALPGHAPGLIGLFRESDRLALCSDAIYTLDPQTGRKGAARVAHPAFDLDVEQARASIRALAQLDPSAVWPGHADPVTGDVAAQLQAAADAPLP